MEDKIRGEIGEKRAERMVVRRVGYSFAPFRAQPVLLCRGLF